MKVMDIIAKETNGKSYRTFKYHYDEGNSLTFDYDDNNQITWKKYGENDPPNRYKSIKKRADEIISNNISPLFTYFLDGSRRTYKVDDIAYGSKVFPVIAGQVGISCCKRQNKRMKGFDYDRRIVVALPKIASQQDWSRNAFFSNLCRKMNENKPELKLLGVEFTDVVPYSTAQNQFERLESKGIAVIQDVMIKAETAMVSRLVKNRHINSDNLLLKDGSLEYRVDDMDQKSKRAFQNNFQNVVGVSKSFNPGNCIDKRGKNNSNIIADIPLYHRTPVCMYQSDRLPGMFYAVWYLRIRDKKYTINTFDGILKIEKILVTEKQKEQGLDTEEVDNITANIINERNPVCYGVDSRWANHLYPVFVTEQ